MRVRTAIAIAFRRAIDKVAELVLGRATFAAITSAPGDDIRVLLGHDGRPSMSPMARRIDPDPSRRMLAVRATFVSQALH